MISGPEWVGTEGAPAAEIDALKQAAPDEAPEQYFNLLAWSNGGEGSLPVSPYTVIFDNAADVAAMIGAEWLDQEDFGALFIFGGNGGGEYIGFDMRKPSPWPVVAVDMVAGIDSAETIATDFDAFLALVGHEEG